MQDIYHQNSFLQSLLEDKNTKLATGLYIVATPIGNLKDITIRALEVLNKVDVIICEDSRVTSKLLDRYEIRNKKLIVYNDHSSEHDRVKILNLLQEKKSLALVSDAGTPLISDPGYKLIEFLHLQSQKIIPIPGPSSLTTALCASAIPCDNFLFLGFMPESKIARCNFLKDLPQNYSLIFFESPRRLLSTLQDIKEMIGNRKICIARELTKIYEEIITDDIENIIKFYSVNSKVLNDSALKGELVLIVSKTDRKIKVYNKTIILSEIKKALAANITIKDLSIQISESYGIHKKEVYNLALEVLSLQRIRKNSN